MLDRIIRFSIYNKPIIGLFIIALIAWGSYSFTQLPIDAVPDITNNQVQVITRAASFGAEDIERFVTFPVEQSMANIPGIEEIRSFSRFGLSVVTIVFKEHIDVYWARQQVSERLNEIKNTIPESIGLPEMAPVTTGLGEIYQYVLKVDAAYQDKIDIMELRSIQDWIVRRQLLGTEGVADVSSYGGYLKQYEVAVDPEKLRSFNLSLTEVMHALDQNNENTGGAYIDKNPNVYFIRSEGLIRNLNDIKSITVKNQQNGVPISIGDIAEVRFGHAVRYGALTHNDNGEAVGGIVMMLKGANSSKVIDNVKARIQQINKNLPQGVTIEAYLDRTKLVNNAIGTVSKNLIEGALIVIFVLVLMLGNVRAGLLVASVIPLAMLFAISLMNIFGVSGNLMSLGAIDFGLIVDGSVIIVEATMHHLGLRKKTLLTQQEMDDEVYQSASSIRTSAAFGEVIILIVYLPILVLTGVEGKMFKPMAQTVSFAILGAFILSLTYVPMMSAWLLSKKIQHKETFSDKLIKWANSFYQPLLTKALNYKKQIITLALTMFALALFVFSRLGAEFIPTLDEGDFAVETRVLTGSSMNETIEAAQKSAKVLQDHFPEVIGVVGKIGSSEIPIDPMPVEACDLMVILKDKREWTSAETRDELAQKMQEQLEEHLPGVTYGFQQPIQMRFNELMTGARQDVVIKVYGEDLNLLADYAEKIGELAKQVEGAADVFVEPITGLPQLIVKYDRSKLAQMKLSVADVNSVLNTAFAGANAGQIFEGEKRFDLMIRYDSSNRVDLKSIENAYVVNKNGAHIPILQVADVNIVVGPNQIQRDDAKRRVIVGFNVRGRDVESIVQEIKKRVGKITMEPGYYVTYGGAFKNLEEARTRLSYAVPAALLLIFALLYFTFHSLSQALLIFSAIPLSAIGGVFALWLRDMPFSISAGVGFIALFGVAVLNGIVLIAEFNRLHKEGNLNLQQIILQGTQIRLRPVLMTALVASLGFLPMAISNGSGAEVQKPLATVVIGGLLSATLLTLIVLPILYASAYRFQAKKHSAVLIVLLMLGYSQANAQQQKTITMNEAVQMAISQNYTVKSSELEIAYRKKMNKVAYELPKTDFTLMTGQYNSYYKQDNNLTISQSLPFPTAISSGAAYSRAQLKYSQHQLSLASAELTYRVRLAYVKINHLIARKKLLTKQDSLFAQLSVASQAKYKAGETGLLALRTIEMQQNEVAAQLMQNQSEINQALHEFQLLLQSDAPLMPADTGLIQLPDTYAQQDSIEVNTPTLSIAKQQVEVSKQMKSYEFNKQLPDIKLGYFNQTLVGSHNVTGTEVLYGSGSRFQGFQVGVAIPIWFVPNANKVSAANLLKQKAEAEYKTQQNELSIQSKNQFEQYKQDKKMLTYYNEYALPNALLIEDQAKRSFLLGEISYTEFLYAVRYAMDIQFKWQDQALSYNQSILKLNYLTGK